MKNKFAVCLSHDVDHIKKTFQYATHFIKNIKNRNFSSAFYHIKSVFYDQHYWCFEKIVDIEKKYNLKSTFYFLNESFPFNIIKPKTWPISLGYYKIFNEEIQEIIKELLSGGWEIGLHGSYSSYKNEELLRKEKYDLESITKNKILGVRQHYLNINKATWRIQANIGFLYDASFGYKDTIGFKENKFNVFKPFDDKEFYVVPLSLMDSCVMRQKKPFYNALEVIKLAKEKSACLVLNWHQRIFNEKEFPGYADLYKRLIEECLKQKAEFFTVTDYIKSII